MLHKQQLFNSSVLLVLALGLISCSDSEKGTKVVTPWEVQAPYFKVYNNQTDEAAKSEALNRLDLDSTNLKLSSTDELVFEDAEKYPGSTLLTVTTCSDDKDQIYKLSTRISLLKENAVYRFLPEALLLMPTYQLTKFKCSVHFVAQTPNGSTHDFGQAIQFTITAENRELLAKLEDETEPEVNGLNQNIALITLQRARYFYLPKKGAGHSYRLKCTEFESTNGESQQLFQLIETNSEVQKLEADQICRLLIQDQNGILQISKLFQLRLFDTKNFVELREQKAYGQCVQAKTKFSIEHIVLHNRTKYPIYFSVTHTAMKAFMSFKKHTTEQPAEGRLGFSNEGNQHHDHIRILGDKTISVLLPGQRLIPTFDVYARAVAGHVTMAWIDRAPTLDILAKKSWEDPNDKVITSIPMMSEPSAYALIKQVGGL